MKSNKIISIILVLEFAYMLYKMITILTRLNSNYLSILVMMLFALILLSVSAIGIFYNKKWGVIVLWIFILLSLMGKIIFMAFAPFLGEPYFIIINIIAAAYLSMKSFKEKYFYTGISLFITIITFIALLLYLKSPFILFTGIQIFIPTLLVDLYLMNFLSLDFPSNIIGSFFYYKLFFISFLLFRCFIYGIIVSSIIHLIAKRKLLTINILKIIGIIFISSLIIINIFMFFYVSGISINKIEKFCHNTFGQKSDNSTRDCQLDSLNKLAKKEKDTNCDLERENGNFDYECIVKHYNEKYPNLFCGENGEKYSCKSWGDMVKRIELINKFDKEHPLNPCSNAIRGFGYQRSGSYIKTYDECILKIAIGNNEKQYCEEIILNDNMKDGCLLELDKDHALTKDKCISYLKESAKNINNYNEEPRYTCLTNNEIKPYNYNVYLTDETKNFRLSYFKYKDGYSTWYNQYSSGLMIFQGKLNGKLHNNFLKIINGEYKKGDKLQTPTKLEEPNTKEWGYLSRLDALETINVSKHNNTTIYDIRLSWKEGRNMSAYKCFVKDNTFIVFKHSATSEIYDGIHLNSLVESFIFKGFKIPTGKELQENTGLNPFETLDL